ncbi:RluA family pseudouridine synthase [Bulleidia sp. zg-1006]|uniref:RluA family pseudouridine synthase n=1 Tax=Bulleidia sp. zg-1006 TaxID=2806552 RepID=UPI00193ACA38|nr:RluA family pseudouridine synthase [Bulleidia sp. zg-1006]QRG86460.1 RluA family pseudouridine synthase [Bulleidia sp. zg-1006]
MAEKINILYEDNHLLVVEKPINVLSQADNTQEEDMVNRLKEFIKVRDHKPGNVFIGLVHRLDRPVGGLMVFSKTSKAASRLSNALRCHTFQKGYLAIVDSVSLPKEDTLEDYLYKDNQKNRVFVVDKKKGKYARLHYEVLAQKQGKSFVRIALETGRPHQIRVQFSSRNWPLVNDQRYHPHPTKAPICLFAYKLSFPHPTKKEVMRFELHPKADGAWSLFKEVLS